MWWRLSNLPLRRRAMPTENLGTVHLGYVSIDSCRRAEEGSVWCCLFCVSHVSIVLLVTLPRAALRRGMYTHETRQNKKIRMISVVFLIPYSLFRALIIAIAIKFSTKDQLSNCFSMYISEAIKSRLLFKNKLY